MKNEKNLSKRNSSGFILLLVLGVLAALVAVVLNLIEVVHLETPSPLNAFGVKGLGEGGAIAPPVVIANAVCDALRSRDAAPVAVPPPRGTRTVRCCDHGCRATDRTAPGAARREQTR